MTYTYGDNWTFVNMRDTLTDWEYPIELIKITQSVVNGFKQETQKKIKLKGVWQPLSMAKLMSKPEGMRSWQWYWLHCKCSNGDLNAGDHVIFKGIEYKVMNAKNYCLNGFEEYELVNAYQDVN
jgi:hypothetical protein